MGRRLTSSSWGKLPIVAPARVIRGDWRLQPLPELVADDSLLPYGAGRSYGDSCINSDGSQVSTRQLNRFIHFDSQAGVLCCEAGVTLDEILQLIVPQGWFLPVVPGTRHITLGGAIANDVHGKNHHHAGTFGCHVRSLELLGSDGSRTPCSPAENSGLFSATIGGLGLTGLITFAEVGLVAISSSVMLSENVPFSSIQHFVQLSEDSASWDYTVAWVDSLAKGKHFGRGILTRSKHAEDNSGLALASQKVLPGLPLTPPFSLVGNLSVTLFNRLYHYLQARKTGLREGHYQPFFFPLDSLANWNRIYGSAGFYQYQCVVPHEGGVAAIERLLGAIARSGQGSFLAVLKVFGDILSPGMLSFPRPGLTLALDFPNRGETTLRLFEALDETVLACGGALYPAKDARMPATLFSAGYSQLDLFREHVDPKFSSAFWRRVQI